MHFIDAALQAEHSGESAMTSFFFLGYAGTLAWLGVLHPRCRVFSDWEREKVRRFAAAGYPPLVVEGDPANRVTAMEVRRALVAGEAVPGSVPVGARELLQSWLGTTPEVAHAR